MGFPDPKGGNLVQEDDDEFQYSCLSHRGSNGEDESSEPFPELPLIMSRDGGKQAILQALQVDERGFHNVGLHSATFDDSERVATLIPPPRSGTHLDDPSNASEFTFGTGRPEEGTSNDVDASGISGRQGTDQGKLSRSMENWTDDPSHEAIDSTGPNAYSPPRRTVQSYEGMSRFGGAIWRLKFPDGRVVDVDNYFRVAITEPLKKVLKEAFTEAFGFMMIKLHLQSFIRPTLAESRDNAELNGNGEHMSQRVGTTEQERNCRSLWQRTQRTLRDVFVVAGYMEPPLRWRCRCGDAFWSDVMEYRPGGINRAIQRMEQATGTKVTVTSHNKSSTNQNWSFNMPRWTQYFLPGARPGSNKTPKLPQHNPPVPISTRTTLATAGLSPPSGVSIRLLDCIH